VKVSFYIGMFFLPQLLYLRGRVVNDVASGTRGSRRDVRPDNGEAAGWRALGKGK
jgi:hypothetical protein